MLPLHQLLSRFKNLTNTEKVKKELVCDLLKKNNIPVTVNQVSFSKNTIFLKTQPIIKSEIFLKKNEILEIVKTIPGLSGVDSIQ